MNNRGNDVELLRRSLRGCSASFEVLVGRYQSLVCAITYGATLNLDKSEELAQETFLLAWKNLSQLKDLTKFKTWLCRIAKRVIQNWLRTRRRDVLAKSAPIEVATQVPSDAVQPVQVAIDREQQSVVSQALECIPESYRLPLILFYRENRSTREVGQFLGLSDNATRQRIARARQLLKDQVATMVETTLTQSKPGKAFATGVIASLAALSIKETATAVAGGATAVGFSTGLIKMVSLAAGLLAIVGVSVWVHHRGNPTAPTPVTQTAVSDSNNPEPATTVEQAPANQQQDPAVQVLPNEIALPPDIVNIPALSEPFDGTFTFKPQGVLSGVITCAQTGEPVQDASVYFYDNNRSKAKTDEHGFYHIDKISRSGNFQIYIDSNDYVGFGRGSNNPVLDLNPDQQVVQDFQLPRACKVAVQVVDVNGVPLEGIRVVPTSMAGNANDVINDHGIRMTDSNGRILLGGFPPASTDYMITAIKEEVVRYQFPGDKSDRIKEIDTLCPSRTLIRLTDPNVTVRAKIIMERGETIYGYAEYRDGKPATNIKLGLQPSWWHSPHRDPDYIVEPNGMFAIPHVISGTYDIVMSVLDEDGSTASSQTVMRKDLSIEGGDPLFVKLSMDSPQVGVAIRGRLYLLGEGHPDDVFISVRSGKKEIKELIVAMRGSLEDVQGKRFSITGLEAETYDLHVDGGNIRSRVFSDITAPIDNLELELELFTSPTLIGRVVDEQTRQSISDFEIRAKRLRGNFAPDAAQWTHFTDPNGQFQLEMVGPGEYQVQVLADGYAPCWSDPVDTDAEPNDIIVSLDKGGTIVGRVVNQMGEAIDGAKVLPLSLAGDVDVRREHLFATQKGATLTQDGVFTLSHVPEGMEAIKVMHPDYTFLIQRDIAVTSGQATILDDLVLTMGGALEGVVLDEQGLPLVHETLCFCDAELGQTPDPAQRWGTAVTDATGFYSIPHLPARKCYVYREGYQQATGVTRRSMTTIDGEITCLDFGGDYRVTGTLVMKEGNAAKQRIKISAPHPMDFECSSYTDNDGRFQMTGIVPGTYFVNVLDKNEERNRWVHISMVTVVDHDVDLGVVRGSLVSFKGLKKPTETTLTSTESRLRTLLIQLPLLQPGVQWTFNSRADFLAGKLRVRLTHEHKTEEFIVFENGMLSDDWDIVSLPQPKAGEIYTAFQSRQKMMTGPDDQVVIELQVVKDLDGISDLQTGMLPAGVYQGQGKYALLTDEYEVPEAFKSMPQEVVDKMRENMSYRAVTGHWQTYWPLEITSDQGWLEGAQREQMKRLREMTEKLRNRVEEVPSGQ